MTVDPRVLVRRDHARVAPAAFHRLLNRAAALTDDPRPSPDPLSMRRRLDRSTERLPSVPGVTSTPENVGGVRGLWLRSRHCRDDAAVLYLHGGAYTGGGSHTHAFLLSHLARLSDLPFFLADYRLAPEHPFPAALDDAVAALDDLSERLGHHRVAIAGDSAGGGLATATLVHRVAQNAPTPAAAALLAPWVDLTLGWSTHSGNQGRDILLTADELRLSAEAYAADTGVDNPLVSPVFADLQGLPPTLIQLGTWDLLADEGEELARRMAAASVDIEFDTWQGMQHVFQVYWALLPEARRANHILAAFLRRHLPA